MKKRKLNSKKSVPVGVKVISVFYFIVAFFEIIAGIAILFFGGLLNETLSFRLGLSISDPALLSGTGLFIAALGVFYIFVGNYLWKGRNWARIAAIVISSLFGLFYLVNLILGGFGSIIFVIIHGVILLYLLLNKEVKSVFS